ncbi:MAG: LTA synthase family protein [Oscillibacter sp.]|nr:LTA synthase family protein [Oscillibacter sp.]
MRRFWLFQNAPEGLPKRRQALFWLWNGGVLLLAGLCLGLLSLFFAYGDYPDTLMKTYFRHPLIVVLNLVPVLLALLTAYGLFGRPWLAFLSADLVVWGLSLGNYYKLRFRDDPLMFQDLKNIRDAAGITLEANYDLTPDKRVWFGLLCLLFGTAFLLCLVRGTLRKKPRLAVLLLAAVLWIPVLKVCADDDIYKNKTQNFDLINRWSSTQVYLSKGFVYPFLHSVGEGRLKPPEGYRTAEARALLDQYTPQNIPEERKVDLIFLQLEAFSDFSRLGGVEGIDFEKAYGTYHALEAESYTGNLVTNIFAGGTINTERAVLTGYADQWNYRENTNSYAWYLGDQGYAVEGSHPSYDWFYNRKNVNRYLGLPTYYFYENRYQDLWSQGLAPDSVLLPEIFRLYEANRDGEGRPYFSFNVTYQGHGPYSTEEVWRGEHFTDGRYSPETANIVDNYLGSVMDTAEQLRLLMDRFRAEERPVVLAVFGDHQPWLGDGNSAYHELGVNLDTATEEGFYHYYSTRYLLWANDAAKQALGNAFTGEGPDVSSCFLMNLLYDLLGWQGGRWAQATAEIWRELSVLTTVGRYVQAGGQLTGTLDESGQAALERYRKMEYFYGTNFQYD